MRSAAAAGRASRAALTTSRAGRPGDDVADDQPLTPEHVAERMVKVQERLKEFSPEVGDGTEQ